MSELSDLVKLLKRDKKTGTDYTGTVTRVENGVAYVQLSGARITDTPAAMSIDAKAGDKVRVRVSNGKAWLTGNDTAPPTNHTKQIKSMGEDNTQLTRRVRAIEAKTEQLARHYSATKNVAITANNSIDGLSPAIGAGITLPPGRYLILAQGFFNSGASSGIRNNQIAVYNNNLLPAIITSSMVRITAAASYFASLTTYCYVEPVVDTKYIVGLNSSITSNAASTRIDAIVLN